MPCQLLYHVNLRRACLPFTPRNASLLWQSSLRDLFNAYTNYGTRVPTSELDGAKFVKVFKDANVLDKSTLVTTDLDIIFSKVPVTQ